MYAILSGILKSLFFKIMYYHSTKEIWDKLQRIYEGDDKVKSDILQTRRIQMESLNMNEEEDIAKFFLGVDEVVNTIKGLGKNIEESTIVQKVLRSILLRFNPKVSTIEEMKDIEILKMDELHGILTTYEMKISVGSL